MRFFRILVRYSASPVFLALGFVNFLLVQSMDSQMQMSGMDMALPTLRLFGWVLPIPVETAIQSMWLMYVLMGLFHAGAWLDLASGRHGARVRA